MARAKLKLKAGALPTRRAPKKPGPPLERDVQRVCLEYLRLRGAFCWRANSGALRVPAAGGRKGRYVRFNSAEGCSDVLAVLWARAGGGPETAGRLLALEVKRPGEKPTAKQQRFLESVRRAGGLALVAAGLDDLAGQLREAGY